MAIVKNQDLPLGEIEDQLDPPIPFDDQYRRTLGEGIYHPKLPVGEEMVTFSKKESRPAERSSSKFSKPANREAWREKFKECLACWAAQVDTEEDIDECHSAGSRHYVKPWVYVPGAQNTYFQQFMKDCLDWNATHSEEKFPKCDDLMPQPSEFEVCGGDFQEFEFTHENGPHLTNWPCGGYVDALTWEAPGNIDLCPELIQLEFEDLDFRRGCAFATKKDPELCCCTEMPALEMSYTTLEMGLNEQQVLSVDPAFPGCPPYEWELDGPGQFSDPTETTITYTAPVTAVGCPKANITLRDKCETTANISIRITGWWETYLQYEWVLAWTTSCIPYQPEIIYHWYIYRYSRYCGTGEIEFGPTYETEITTGSPDPETSPTFCCDEGEDEDCLLCVGGGQNRYGKMFTTGLCHLCKEVPPECCPQEE